MCVLLAFLAVTLASLNVFMCLSAFIIHLCESFNGHTYGKFLFAVYGSLGQQEQQTIDVIMNLL